MLVYSSFKTAILKKMNNSIYFYMTLSKRLERFGLMGIPRHRSKIVSFLGEIRNVGGRKTIKSIGMFCWYRQLMRTSIVGTVSEGFNHSMY
jgi:hypothetical protein